MEDDALGGVDVAALLASTRHLLPASGAENDMDVNNILKGTAAADDFLGGDLTPEDLNDASLLDSLKEIGWLDEEEEGGGKAAPHPKPKAKASPVPAPAQSLPPPQARTPAPGASTSVPASHVPAPAHVAASSSSDKSPGASVRASKATPADHSDLEVAIAALDGDISENDVDVELGEDDCTDVHVPVSGIDAAEVPGATADVMPPPRLVTDAEIQSRVRECIKEALKCKQEGDTRTALQWLACKKVLTRLQDEANGRGVLESGLPPRPGDPQAQAQAQAHMQTQAQSGRRRQEAVQAPATSQGMSAAALPPGGPQPAGGAGESDGKQAKSQVGPSPEVPVAGSGSPEPAAAGVGAGQDPSGQTAPGGLAGSPGDPDPSGSVLATAAYVDERIKECVRQALACKQEGNRQRALEWLACKRALTRKQDEMRLGPVALSSLPPRPSADAGQEPAMPGGATVQRGGDAAAGAPARNEPTAHQAAAGATAGPAVPPTAASSQPQQPLQAPPQLQHVEMKDLGWDELEVTLVCADLKANLLPTPEPHTFAAFRLNLPNATSQEGSTPVVRRSASPAYDSSFIVNFDRSKGSTKTAFAHRRMSVEVRTVQHTGLRRFFTAGPALLAKADVKLAPLLQQHELRGKLPLRAAEGGDSPGTITVGMRLAAPINAPAPADCSRSAEAEASAPRAQRTAPTAAQQAVANRGPAAGKAPAVAPPAVRAAPVPVAPGAANHTPPASAAAAAEGETSFGTRHEAGTAAPTEAEEEENDFAYAERIASFDVLNWELEELAASRGVYSGVPRNSPALDMRRNALETRKLIIETKVGTGQLTMDAYLSDLRKAITAEQRVAIEQKGTGTIAGKARAIHALKRVKVMKEELLGAEQAASDDRTGADE